LQNATTSEQENHMNTHTVKTDNDISTPRSWSNGFEIGLQRTCKLVDEWSARHHAEIRISKDEDVLRAEKGTLTANHYRVKILLVDRRYRVAATTDRATTESQMITGFVARWNTGNHAPAQRLAATLRAAGYSQEAIDEITH